VASGCFRAIRILPKNRKETDDMTKEITVPKTGKAPVTQEQVQEKLMMFQLMEKQLESMRQQAMMIEQRLMEIETTKAALKEIGSLKQGNDALVPIGSGLFIKASIREKEKVMTEIGSNIMKKKSLADARQYLGTRQKEIEIAGHSLNHEMEKVSGHLQKMGPELQELANQVRQQG